MASKNPWRQARGKRFLAWFCWLLRVKFTRWAAAARAAAGGRPRTLGSTDGTVGSVQSLSLRVDTLSSLSLMRSVKWCRERRMTV